MSVENRSGCVEINEAENIMESDIICFEPGVASREGGGIFT